MYIMGKPDKYDNNQEPTSDLLIFFPISDFLIPIFHFFGFLPNHITYLSIFSTLVSIYLYRINNMYSYLFYFLGYLFDAMDGRMARKYSQTSIFGMMLDLVSDNLTNLPLLLILLEKSLISYFENWYIGVIKLIILSSLLFFVFAFSVFFGMNEALDSYNDVKNSNFYLYKKELVKKSLYYDSNISKIYLFINKTSYQSYCLFFNPINESNKLYIKELTNNYRELGSGNLNLYALFVMFVISNL